MILKMLIMDFPNSTILLTRVCHKLEYRIEERPLISSLATPKLEYRIEEIPHYFIVGLFLVCILHKCCLFVCLFIWGIIENQLCMSFVLHSYYLFFSLDFVILNLCWGFLFPTIFTTSVLEDYYAWICE